MTQLEYARKGTLTRAMKKVAADEGVDPDSLLALIASGKAVIPFNPNHFSSGRSARRVRRGPRQPIGIGFSLRTKVNVNIGTSADFPRLEDELKKVDIALKYRADAIMDLSTGGDLRKIRRRILGRTPIILGTVPVYQAAIEAIDRRGSIVKMTEDDLFATIETQAQEIS
jgi:phosphomethylpyrimidine synthase